MYINNNNNHDWLLLKQGDTFDHIRVGNIGFALRVEEDYLPTNFYVNP